MWSNLELVRESVQNYSEGWWDEKHWNPILFLNLFPFTISIYSETFCCFATHIMHAFNKVKDL